MGSGGGGGGTQTTTEGDPSIKAYTAAVVPQLLAGIVPSAMGNMQGAMQPYTRQFAGESPLQQMTNQTIAAGLSQTPQAYGDIMNWGYGRANAPSFQGVTTTTTPRSGSMPSGKQPTQAPRPPTGARGTSAPQQGAAQQGGGGK
jgi:hypothetical protein